MNNAEKIVEEIKTVAEGFKDVPVEANPPKIAWGEKFKGWDDTKKLSYLMKFAEAMNHAAAKIQGERDQLAHLIDLKEKQVESSKMAMEQNSNLLQSEITRMNSDRQEYNTAIAKLNKKVRELENGNNH